MTNSTILNNEQINHKIRRIAYQILESNTSEKEIIVAGVANNGFIYALLSWIIVKYFSC